MSSLEGTRRSAPFGMAVAAVLVFAASWPWLGGVVAEGYLAWPCADGRICCDEGPDPRYPHDLSILATVVVAGGRDLRRRSRGVVHGPAVGERGRRRPTSL
jgi:hypothetical protein